MKPVICIDFDGTLCDHEYPNIGKIKAGAKEALASFRKMGFHILIYSCRTCHWNYDIFGGDPSQSTLERKHVKEMIAFLDENGLEYDEVDDGSKGKPLASLYIDDKALRFTDNWKQIQEFVENTGA